MNATKIASRFAETFQGTTAAAVLRSGVWYIVTDETGDGVFAYLADDVTAALDAVDEAVAAGLPEDVATYQIFCDNAEPVEDTGLAAGVYRMLNKRICHAGSCDPVDIAG